MKKYSLGTIVLALLLSACAPEAPQIDLEAERAAILSADKAWSETPANVEAFVAFFAEGARLLPPEAPIANGREEIEKTVSQLFSSPGFSVSWNATMADVSSAGDLGYSVGTFELTVNNAEGEAVSRKGKYLTVWKKQDDRQWKAVSDVFNFDGPLPAAKS